MSHIASINLVMEDLEAVEAACQAMGGLHLVRGQKTFRWYGRWMQDYNAEDAAFNHGIKPEDYGKCDHVITVDGSGYDIGLVKNPNGAGYILAYDFYGTGRVIQERIGVKGEAFKQQYALQVARKKLAGMGASIQQFKMADGSIRLVAAGGRL